MELLSHSTTLPTIVAQVYKPRYTRRMDNTQMLLTVLYRELDPRFQSF